MIQTIKKDFWVGVALVLIVATVVSFILDRDLRVNSDPYGNYEQALGRTLEYKGPDSD